MALLHDALARTLQAADIAGIRAVIVHAKDDEARASMSISILIQARTDPYHLHLLIKDLRKATQGVTSIPRQHESPCRQRRLLLSGWFW
ncbi:MAG: hypothetical protein IPO58_24770 [Betaproteobacteria bacterium]|nr:hypothetical protein [Betaproteobacteria bacterium]